MKIEEYNNVGGNYIPKYNFMRNSMFRKMRMRNDIKVIVYSAKIKDRDGDVLYLTVPAYSEREIKFLLRFMVKCEILDLKEVWSFKVVEATENEHMLMKRGYFASESIIEKEIEL